jgi:hypothetical protein
MKNLCLLLVVLLVFVAAPAVLVSYSSAQETVTDIVKRSSDAVVLIVLPNIQRK